MVGVQKQMSRLKMALLPLLISVGSIATAQDSGTPARPNEDSIFQDKKDTQGLDSSDPSRDAFASGEVTDNALQIGGIYYQRMILSGQQGSGTGNAPLSLPLQFDGFMDARPNDRLRGFVDGRLLYDAARDQFSNSTSGNSAGSQQFTSTSTAPSGLAGATPVHVPNNPQVALDQAWLKFDIDRTVFVTAGKQHVKWGASRFWNPTDFLSTQKRDPLLPYDLRLGNSMVKFELPLEAKKTNFYGIVLFDNPQPASTLGQVGGALRAETLIGNAEIGLETVARGGLNPVFGADISAPLGPFDVYAEASCISGASTSLQSTGTPTAGTDISTLFTSNAVQGPLYQISGGGNYMFGWRENRQATVGLEYFYNQLGYGDSTAYPALIFTGQFQPFYTGRNYAAIYLTAEGPDSEKHTSYTFSTLGNLSDQSFISRIDFSWRVLTYLTFESYIDAHYGTPGGEFNFTVSTPPLTFQGTSIATIDFPPTFFDLGMALRLSI